MNFFEVPHQSVAFNKIVQIYSLKSVWNVEESLIILFLNRNGFIFIYKNGRTDVYVSVGMCRANGNPKHCTDLDEICTHIPNCPRKVLVQV